MKKKINKITGKEFNLQGLKLVMLFSRSRNDDDYGLEQIAHHIIHINDIINWLYFENKLMYYYSEITIPDDTQIYREEIWIRTMTGILYTTIFKPDKFIIEDSNKVIWENEKICKTICERDEYYPNIFSRESIRPFFKHVVNKNEELCLIAVRTCGENFLYVPPQLQTLKLFNITLKWFGEYKANFLPREFKEFIETKICLSEEDILKLSESDFIEWYQILFNTSEKPLADCQEKVYDKYIIKIYNNFIERYKYF